MSIRKILDYLEGLDSKTLPVISKTRSSNPLTFDKKLPMDDGIKWDKNGFAPKIRPSVKIPLIKSGMLNISIAVPTFIPMV